ncbi:AAA family ATPase [Knoellia sp. CPCC 206435]|uniref:AAA family ATPase n=1 Tax=Knoellia terrae TaxID=3404797 RepID=UPI003B43B2D6
MSFYGTNHPQAADPLDDINIAKSTREVVLTSAATIKPRPVFWLWKGRIALGTIALLAGREGLGKSTLGYWLAARITQGEMFGHFYGTPKSVLVCATEDSWEHTIVPRLMAAGADLARVYRVEVVNALDVHVGLSLPRDNHALERHAREVDAALLLLDPLMSRLGDLDTHRDAEVRQALEPLAAIADRTRMAILGLIHHNKSGSADPLQLVMGSKAFTAVARSVHTVVPDPDDESDKRRLFGTPKNNLGRTDLPTFTFTIESHAIETDEGTAWTGSLTWGEELTHSIGDAMRRAADVGEDRSAATEAAQWLEDYLAMHGGQVPSADIKKAAKAAQITDSALRGARTKLRILTPSSGFPRITYWELPPVVSQSSDPSRGDHTTNTTDTTRGSESQWCQSGQSCDDSRSLDTTDAGGCLDCGESLPASTLPLGGTHHAHCGAGAA